MAEAASAGHRLREADELHAGPWERPLGFLCPARDEDPEPCDCGYVGRWQFRLLFPTYGGLLGGGVRWQERCPDCGDVESFDEHGNIARQRGTDAEVRHLSPRS